MLRAAFPCHALDSMMTVLRLIMKGYLAILNSKQVFLLIVFVFHCFPFKYFSFTLAFYNVDSSQSVVLYLILFLSLPIFKINFLFSFLLSFLFPSHIMFPRAHSPIMCLIPCLFVSLASYSPYSFSSLFDLSYTF